jgi:ABC-type transporter Mla MlaB component
MAKLGQDIGGGLMANVEQRGGSTQVTLAGAVTELANFETLKALRGAARVDLSGIERMNSLGVRAWCHFVRDAEAAGLALTFERCSPVIVEQIAMISNFFGARSQVASLMAPYYCEACGTEHTQLVERSANAPMVVPPVNTCPKCGKPAVVDEPENMYAALSQSLAGR